MAQERSRWSTLSRRKLALLSLASCAAAISLLVASSRMSCNTNEKELDCGKSSQAVIIFVHVGRCFGVVFIMIFLVSGSALIVIKCNKKIKLLPLIFPLKIWITQQLQLAILHCHNCLITSLQFKTFLKFHRNRMRNCGRKILMALMMKMETLHVMSKLLPCWDCLLVRLT